jgi:hypothetical protein
MAKMEDQLRALENRKRLRLQDSSNLTLPPENPIAPTRLAKAPLPSRGSSSYRQTYGRPEALLPSRHSSSCP